MTLTGAQLAEACGCSLMRAETWVEHLNLAAERWGVDGPVQMAAWLAQLAHESGRLTHDVEIWGPTKAQLAYEGRADLGNTLPGDGKRFLGRGPMMLTGRLNYTLFRDDAAQRIAGVRDFATEPERVELPKWGAHAAGWFWWRNRLGKIAESGDFEKLTRRINGGLNGYDDRRLLWAGAKRALGVT